ncbi:isoprenoid biosynthesis glyoxalase ElbB [Paraneptunicella aestuarii]|uniref:isoprenoid biosynthesis glyoxalase ElbB n=1 Tax=Paraneptunicella aestuarii TaxID=2831148 RepID=UPI001E3819AE|nr:isoprenoid biosynthesis glyoxalase ElbB [Paraneptunicella aestuarii]UAA38712.1 isoprenoid biosynthesis glyoxalase ElbB [Paraneptunicella aestuarii]
MKRVAVILSGCGVYDGAEINEAVLTLLHIAKAGASYQCFAPDMEQMHTINHLTGEEMTPNRNVLVEAARIARGDIKAVTELNVADFDALILPGGFGAAKNLSNFAVKGAAAEMQSEVLNVCKAFAAEGKPAGYICIAPAMIPLVYGPGSKTTIGNDADTIKEIEGLGGAHVQCPVQDFVVDEDNKVVSTPAYMLAGSILEADEGISKLVAKVLSLCE